MAFRKSLVSLTVPNEFTTIVTGPAVIKSIEVTPGDAPANVTFKLNTLVNKVIALAANDTFGDDYVHVLESGDTLSMAASAPVNVFAAYAAEEVAQ